MPFLPTYQDLKNQPPLDPSIECFIHQNRQAIRAILNGSDPRLLLIAGPCSIHDTLSAKEFAYYLKSLSDSVQSRFLLVMRVYCEKPRTSTGWKGFLYDPLLDGSNDMLLGIKKTRELLCHLARMGIPAATEFLDPLTAFYYDDLISWGSIGARTSSSQTHRQFASGLQMPIGFKNGIAGNVSAAIEGVIAATQPHSYMGLNEHGRSVIIRTNGNPDAHIVLRGGEAQSNYDPSSISDAMNSLSFARLPIRLLVDCSHHNSEKKYENQPLVFQSVIKQIIEGNENIRGIMLESHLHAGNQALKTPGDLLYGISITDSCLDWNSTRHLIQWGYKQLASSNITAPSCSIACHG
ncbi:MAG: 3-deoxy-7-phosphoheptulonate synthase [Candidatus Protochlamydia sp.]|nr:3-deoxy-7-phosphoheptulonate synthase [Candidatus Protochlamydia sp.]